MLTAVGLAFGDMADAVVVGQKMGAVGLAAVSLVLPVFMVINILYTALELAARSAIPNMSDRDTGRRPLPLLIRSLR